MYTTRPSTMDGVSSHWRASAQACAWRRGPWYASEGWPTSTVAPSISRTTSVTVPAPLWKRSISRKPNTLVIQSAAWPASSSASIGMTRCSAIVGLLRAFASNDALAPRSKRGHDARVTDAVVEVRDLRKTFRVSERQEGLAATLRSFVRRQRRDINAVAGITFGIEAGEVVGFLGPNGAGKTTTLKMLSGLLYPTGGEARVLGFVPWRRENAYLQQMTLLMGNRTQLVWDIPAADSFRILQEIYKVPDDSFRRTVDELTELLELQELVHKPVRNLSLGERMKVEFAAGLIQSPEVAFLDEPTIGLDVSMQSRIRRFVAEYNRRSGATILLTSHYMDDVVALCKRVLVIHQGKLLYDGALSGLAERMTPYKLIVATLHDGAAHEDLDAYGAIVAREEGRVTLRVPRENVAERTARLVGDLGDRLADLSVEDPPIEEAV